MTPLSIPLFRQGNTEPNPFDPMSFLSHEHSFPRILQEPNNIPMIDPPAFGSEKDKKLIEGLANPDKSVILQTLLDLSSELVMAQESSYPSKSLVILIDPLISCVSSGNSSDIISISYFVFIIDLAVTCITHIIDISPRMGHVLAEKRGVEALCNKLKNVESIEVVENIINVLKNISEEIPYSILKSNGLEDLCRILDFFEFSKQVKYIHLSRNCRKKY